MAPQNILAQVYALNNVLPSALGALNSGKILGYRLQSFVSYSSLY